MPTFRMNYIFFHCAFLAILMAPVTSVVVSVQICILASGSDGQIATAECCECKTYSDVVNFEGGAADVCASSPTQIDTFGDTGC